MNEPDLEPSSETAPAVEEEGGKPLSVQPSGQGEAIAGLGLPNSLIYLATPYSHADPSVMQRRFEQACEVAGRLMTAGQMVFSPIAHTHPIAVRCELPRGWEFWRKYDFAMLSAAAKVVVVQMDGWQESKGIAGEIAIAEELGIPVEYLAYDAAMGEPESRPGLPPNVGPCAEGLAQNEGGTACECPTRKALEMAINTVECASIDLSDGPTRGEELPWYKSARAALSLSCPCEGMRKENARLSGLIAEARQLFLNDESFGATVNLLWQEPLREAEAERDSLRAELAREEKAHANTIEQRDAAEEAADKLAYAIAPTEEIGEHSNLNDPWENAVDKLEEMQAEAQERERALRGAVSSVGAARIAAERQRQISVEGWTPEHDDTHDEAELISAAQSYALLAERQAFERDTSIGMPACWPWDLGWWKPSPDPIRNLEKAGALIAAEIDRLTRERDKESSALATPEGTRP